MFNKFFIFIYIVPRINEKDIVTVHKAMQYSKSAYEVAIEAKEAAIEAKEAAIRTELAIKEFLSRCDTSVEGNNDNGQPVIKGSGKYTKKRIYWYTVSIIFIMLVYYFQILSFNA